MVTGSAFRAYGCTHSLRRYAGKRSLGDKLLNTNTNTSSAMSQLLRFQGTQAYHIQTPQKAMMYDDDSEPVLKRTVNISTDAISV